MTAAGPILVEIAPGELIDRITILEIKSERIADTGKLKNIRLELEILNAARQQAIAANAELDVLAAELKQLNVRLWEIEDRIRECERAQDFGPVFIRLARGVYLANDQRAAVKRRISEMLGSRLVDEKSYTKY